MGMKSLYKVHIILSYALYMQGSVHNVQCGLAELQQDFLKTPLGRPFSGLWLDALVPFNVSRMALAAFSAKVLCSKQSKNIPDLNAFDMSSFFCAESNPRNT